MPLQTVSNENMRDELTKYAYPFDEQSLLENKELFLGTDLIIDAALYIKEEAELPLYIKTIDGTVGDQIVRFWIAGANGTVLAYVDTDFNAGARDVYNNESIIVGVVVFHEDGLKRFIGQAAGKIFSLLPTVASFIPDVCHVSKADYLRYVRVDNVAFKGSVAIVARRGVRFRVEGNVLKLDVVGDRASTLYPSTPIQSLNNIKQQAFWLAGEPIANLRISTKPGKLEFVSVKDSK